MVFLVTFTMVAAAAAASLVLASVTSERGKGRQTTSNYDERRQMVPRCAYLRGGLTSDEDRPAHLA